MEGNLQGGMDDVVEDEKKLDVALAGGGGSGSLVAVGLGEVVGSTEVFQSRCVPLQSMKML